MDSHSHRMETKQRILVVGGAGFIGSHIVEAIARSGLGCVVADNLCTGKQENCDGTGTSFHQCDCADMQALGDLLRKETITTVINVATRSLPYSLSFPFEAVRETIGVTQALCELQRLGTFRTLVHLSSSEVYGQSSVVPITEETPPNPTTPYAAAKAACDAIVLSYVRTFHSRSVIVRPFNQFGVRQQRGRYGALIARVIDAVMQKTPITIHGSGKQTRDFLFVTDLAFALACLVEQDAFLSGDVIQIASGRERSVNEIIETIFSLMGARTDVVHGPDRPGDIERQAASIEKASALLSWSPATPFEDGLRQTIDWHRAHP